LLRIPAKLGMIMTNNFLQVWWRKRLNGYENKSNNNIFNKINKFITYRFISFPKIIHKCGIVSCHLAFAPQRTLLIDLAVISIRKEVRCKKERIREALQRRIHVARVPEVVQPHQSTRIRRAIIIWRVWWACVRWAIVFSIFVVRSCFVACFLFWFVLATVRGCRIAVKVEWLANTYRFCLLFIFCSFTCLQLWNRAVF
jgi:hypothetical protein